MNLDPYISVPSGSWFFLTGTNILSSNSPFHSVFISSPKSSVLFKISAFFCVHVMRTAFYSCMIGLLFEVEWLSCIFGFPPSKNSDPVHGFRDVDLKILLPSDVWKTVVSPAMLTKFIGPSNDFGDDRYTNTFAPAGNSLNDPLTSVSRVKSVFLNPNAILRRSYSFLISHLLSPSFWSFKLCGPRCFSARYRYCAEY